jgi:carbamate kinase
MKLVIALGGNALLRRSQAPSAGNQLANVRVAAEQLARVAAAHDIVLTHGNGPQVGLLALQSAAYTAVETYPLDVLDAESEGMLGYLLEQELANRLPAERIVVSLLTRVEVDADDPAFAQPTKPIGPMYSRAQAEPLAAARHWAVGPDGSGWRRLVASPQPRRVLALQAIGWLLGHGALVIAAGGGGIPVVRRPDGSGLQGVEAVIDKDLCSALIATGLQADVLLIATDVAAVCLDWGGPTQRALGRTTPRELAQHDFAAGSMAPKVAAACHFVQANGRRAVIGALDSIEALLAGTAGTQITPDEALSP